MPSKKEQDKLHPDRHQLIIQELLRDEDNKYCVDCDAKGPRWASWNIGVFLCIRCAGIHRNLGVHISKVKSVNLDCWTLSQLAMMRDMGNSRARGVYEARLPDNFRRPQSDTALESFIRAKYEHKRYVALEYVPTEPDVDALLKEIQRLEQSNKRQRHNPNGMSIPPLQQPASIPRKQPVVKTGLVIGPPPTAQPLAEPDLLGLNSASSDLESIATARSSDDPFQQFDLRDQERSSFTTACSTASTQSESLSNDLVGLQIGGVSVPSVPLNTIQPILSAPVANPDTKASKDAILALYQQYPAIANAPGLVAPPLSHQPLFAAPQIGSQSQWQSGTQKNRVIEQPISFPFTEIGAMDSPLVPQPAYGHSGAPRITFPTPTTIPMTLDVNNSFQAAPSVPWPERKPSWPQPDQPALFSTYPSKSAIPAVGQNSFPDRTFLNGMPNQVSSGFSAPILFVPGSVNTTAAAHQAYLSQVQNQLASLQLGSAANNSQ